MEMTPRRVRLGHSLMGYRPHRFDERVEIPKGTMITVLNYDGSETDSLVDWNGRILIVDKGALETFEESL